MLKYLLFVILIFNSACGVIYNNSIKDTYDPDYRYIEVDGLKTRIFESGDPQKQTIVYVHSNLGSIYDLTTSPLLDELENDYHIVAYDRPGLGFSDRKSFSFYYSPDDFADHLDKLIKELNLKDAIVIGHSWGGAVSLAYANKYQENIKAMVLLAPAAYPWPKYYKTFLKEMLPATPLLGDLYLQTVHIPIAKRLARKSLEGIANPLELPDEYLDKAIPLAINTYAFKNAARDTIALKGQLARISENYSQIALPTVIFADPKDNVVWTDVHAIPLAKNLRNAKLIQVKNVGHLIQFGATREIANTLRDLSE